MLNRPSPQGPEIDGSLGCIQKTWVLLYKPDLVLIASRRYETITSDKLRPPTLFFLKCLKENKPI